MTRHRRTRCPISVPVAVVLLVILMGTSTTAITTAACLSSPLMVVVVAAAATVTAAVPADSTVNYLPVDVRVPGIVKPVYEATDEADVAETAATSAALQTALRRQQHPMTGPREQQEKQHKQQQQQQHNSNKVDKQATAVATKSAGNRSTDESRSANSGDAVRVQHSVEVAESGEKDHQSNEEAHDEGGHEEAAAGAVGAKARSSQREKHRKYEKGFLNRYHKKEYHKLHKFYGNAHQGGEYHKYGRNNQQHQSESGGSQSGQHQHDGGSVKTLVKLKPATTGQQPR